MACKCSTALRTRGEENRSYFAFYLCAVIYVQVVTSVLPVLLKWRAYNSSGPFPKRVAQLLSFIEYWTVTFRGFKRRPERATVLACLPTARLTTKRPCSCELFIAPYAPLLASFWCNCYLTSDRYSSWLGCCTFLYWQETENKKGGLENLQAGTEGRVYEQVTAKLQNTSLLSITSLPFFLVEAVCKTSTNGRTAYAESLSNNHVKDVSVCLWTTTYTCAVSSWHVSENEGHCPHLTARRFTLALGLIASPCSLAWQWSTPSKWQVPAADRNSKGVLAWPKKRNSDLACKPTKCES